MKPFTLTVVGRIRSPLRALDQAPRQGDEGAPEVWIDLDPRLGPAVVGLAAGDDIVVLTWLHLADRATLQTRPRDDATRPLSGVFATRSPHRPNPIGLHDATVLEVRGARLRVAGVEAVDGTPVLDIKPRLGPLETR
jgi:tRNA-Thr(GGU) m(6)t(6)A37 methyltransferase TsaA